MDFWDVARVVVVLSCVIISIKLVQSARDGWARWSGKTKDHWWYEFSWTLLIGVYGTIEGLWMNSPGGMRVVMGLFTCFVGFRAVFSRGDVYVEERTVCDIGMKRGWKCTRGDHRVGPCALTPKWWNVAGMAREVRKAKARP